MNDYNYVYINAYLTKFRNAIPSAGEFTKADLFHALASVGIHHATIGGREIDKFYRWELEGALSDSIILKRIEANLLSQRDLATMAAERLSKKQPNTAQAKYNPTTSNKKRESNKDFRVYDPMEDMDWLIQHYGVDYDEDVD